MLSQSHSLTRREKTKWFIRLLLGFFLLLCTLAPYQYLESREKQTESYILDPAIQEAAVEKPDRDFLRIMDTANYLGIKNSERVTECLLAHVDKEHWEDVLVIICKESRGDSLACNGHDFGIMQINKQHFRTFAKRDSIYYMDYNIKTAYGYFTRHCLKDHSNRFKRYNGGIKYQNDAMRLLNQIKTRR